MSRLLVAQYMSLDGVVQAPGHADEDSSGGFGQGGWTQAFMHDHRRINDEFFQTASALLMGRLTYEIFASYWPTVSGETDEIAKALNDNPKFVVSNTLTEASWEGTTILTDAGAAEIPTVSSSPPTPPQAAKNECRTTAQGARVATEQEWRSAVTDPQLA